MRLAALALGFGPAWLLLEVGLRVVSPARVTKPKSVAVEKPEKGTSGGSGTPYQRGMPLVARQGQAVSAAVGERHDAQSKLSPP